MQRNSTNSMIRSAFEAHRQTLVTWCNELYVEGYTKTKYDVTNIRWDDMSRYSKDGAISCWGPDIADTSSHLRMKDSYLLDGKKIEDAHLVQALERTRTLKKANCVALYRKDGKVDYLYKSRGKVKMMTHDGMHLLAREDSAWIVQGGNVLTEEAKNLVQQCTVDGNARRFTHSDRTAWVLPNGVDTVWLANYVQGSLVPCKKEKTLSFDAEDEERKHLNGPLLLNVEAMEDAAEVNEAGDLAVCTSADAFLVLHTQGGCSHVKCCKGEDIPLFAIRSPNLVERLSKVSLDRVKVSDGTKMVTLEEMASKAGSYAEEYGLQKDVSLSSPADKELVNTIRMQVSIVPTSVNGEAAEVYEKIYDYRTHDDKRPTALYSYHTSFGTSFASSGSNAVKIQPCMHDGTSLSAFNLRVEASKKRAGDDATYTAAENRENLDAGFGMAIPLGPIGFPRVANATLLTQWPVSSTAPQEEPVYRSLPYQDDGEESSAPVYRSLSVGEPTLYASRMGLGTKEGEARGIKAPDLRRRTESNPTMTYTRFYSLDAPVDGGTGLYTITKEQLKGIIKMMDEMYELAGNAHLLSDKEAVNVVPSRKVALKRMRPGYTFNMIE